MKNILSILVTFLTIIFNIGVVHGGEVYYDSSCSSGRYGAYSYPSLSDGHTYVISRGSTRVTVVCRNGYISIDSDTNSYRNYDYNPNFRNTYSNRYRYDDRYYNNNSYNRLCNSGTYRGDRYPRLRNGETYKVRNGNSRTTLSCNNGYVSMRSYSSNNYNNYYSSSNTCRSGRYRGFSYPTLRDGKVYTSKDGDRIARLVCRDGRIYIQKITTTYDDRYDYNRYDGINNYDYYNDSYDRGSCTPGKYSAVTYPRLQDWQTYNKRLRITGGYASVTLKCRDGHISISKRSTICDSGYYRYSNTCRRNIPVRYNENYYY